MPRYTLEESTLFITMHSRYWEDLDDQRVSDHVTCHVTSPSHTAAATDDGDEEGGDNGAEPQRPGGGRKKTKRVGY